MSRRPTYALLAALAILAIVLGAIGAGYSSRQPAQKMNYHDVVTQGKSTTGTLLVMVGTNGTTVGQVVPHFLLNITVVSSCTPTPREFCLGTPVNVTSSGTAFLPLANVSVTVVGIGGVPLSPLALMTNSSGELQIPLPPGEMSVTVSSPYIRGAALAKLYAGNVTLVEAVAQMASFPVLFGQVPEDGSTGLMAPWTHGYAQVDAPFSAFSGNSSYSLQYSNVTTFGGCQSSPLCILPASLAQDEPVNLTSVSPSVNGSVWVSFQPKGFMEVEGVDISNLVAYTPQISVTILGH